MYIEVAVKITRDTNLELELLEEVLCSGSLLLALVGSGASVSVLENLLDGLAGGGFVVLGEGVLVDSLLQVDVNRVSTKEAKKEINM